MTDNTQSKPGRKKIHSNPVDIHIVIESDLVTKLDEKVISLRERGLALTRSDVIRSCIALYFR